MHRALLVFTFVALTLTARAANQAYPREVTRWQEVSGPSVSDLSAREVWLYAANYSKHTWRVFAEGGRICAQLITGEPPKQGERPKFTPKASRFRDVSAFRHVDDGWLVGFNEGEFGAALYWFSPDGKRKYKVSDHQVVDFFTLPDGLHAIEGLAHLGMSDGSIIRIARPDPRARWHSSNVVKLPFAPSAISVRRDVRMFVTLSDSLVSIGNDRNITTLASGSLWSWMYPDSSVLSRDERKLYIGMRQFVAEFDIPTKKLRFLIPSDKFLNKLPKDDEERIRRQPHSPP